MMAALIILWCAFAVAGVALTLIDWSVHSLPIASLDYMVLIIFWLIWPLSLTYILVCLVHDFVRAGRS